MAGLIDQRADAIYRRSRHFRNTNSIGQRLDRKWLKSIECVDDDPIRFRKMGTEIHQVLISRVISVKHWLGHVGCLERRHTGELKNDVVHVLEARRRVVVDFREVQEGGEDGGAGGEEVVSGDPHVVGDVEGGGAEDVDDEGADGGGLRDVEEGLGDVRAVEANEVEGNGGGAAGGGGVDLEEGEAAEGDGRVGVGDAADVSEEGGGVEAAGGEEDGYGESVGEVAENELAQLHHRHYVSDSRSCVENNGVLL